MAYYLGIDTSNYTTSVSLYNSDTNEMVMSKKLLPVKENNCGLRQSDAVFLHVKQLGEIFQDVFHGEKVDIKAVGVSAFPRRMKGSYMPSFLVGEMVATSISCVLNIPKYDFSHQEGHIVSGLYSADKLNWLENSEFYAFHVSGGTTEALKVVAKSGDLQVDIIGKTLDLNAGQAIDRVGVMLGLPFPSGRFIEELALKCEDKIKVKSTVKGFDCCLSGVENKCIDFNKKGYSKEYISKYVLHYVENALRQMTNNIFAEYGKKSILYVGGVMSNSIIRNNFERDFQGYFATPQYSADNSAGIAILAMMQDKKR